MEEWRQGRLSSQEDHSTIKRDHKTNLTHIGLLMEGLGLDCRNLLRESPNQRLLNNHFLRAIYAIHP
jgi:hypothetical protein